MRNLPSIFLNAAICIMLGSHAMASEANVPTEKVAVGDSIVLSFPESRTILFAYRDKNLAKLEEFAETVKMYQDELKNGTKILRLESFYNLTSSPTDREFAKTRNNHIKSWYIERGLAKESYFKTTNYPNKKHNDGNIAILYCCNADNTPATSKSVKTSDNVKSAVPVPAPASTETNTVTESQANDNTEPQQTVATSDAQEQTASPQAIDEPKKVRKPSKLSDRPHMLLRANLLHWAILSPDLGIEVRPIEKLGMIVTGTWSNWTWKDGDRRFYITKLNPEIRYYIGKNNRWYAGAEYHTGDMNIKLNDEGRRGYYRGAGVTGGYNLPIGRVLTLDFNIGIGNTYTKYDIYERIDNVNIKTGYNSKDIFGLTQLGVNLVWKLF